MNFDTEKDKLAKLARDLIKMHAGRYNESYTEKETWNNNQYSIRVQDFSRLAPRLRLPRRSVEGAERMTPIITNYWKSLAKKQTEQAIISMRKREKIPDQSSDCSVCAYMRKRGVNIMPFRCDCPASNMCRKFCMIIREYHITRAGIRALKAHIKELEK